MIGRGELTFFTAALPKRDLTRAKLGERLLGAVGPPLVVSEWLQVHNFPQVSKRPVCAGQGYETWCASRVCLCRSLAPCYHRTGSLALCRVVASAPKRHIHSTSPSWATVQAGARRAMPTMRTTRLNPRPGRASRAASMDMARCHSAGRETLLVAHPRLGRLRRQASESGQGPGPWDGEFALALR